MDEQRTSGVPEDPVPQPRSMFFLPHAAGSGGSYSLATAEERSRLLRRWLVVLSMLMVVCLGLDALAGPDMLYTGFQARILFWLPISAICIGLLRSPLPPWLEAVVAALPVVTGTAVIGTLADLAPIHYSERYLAAAGILCFTTNLCFPLLFRQALFVSSAATATFAAIALAGPEPMRTLDYVLFVVLMTVVTSFSLKRTEDSRVKAFELALLSKAQAEALEKSNLSLQELSITDPLTGISNRRGFDTRLAAAWQARGDRTLAIAMVDIDNFKKFNDALGHVRGDDCLVLVARSIMRVALDHQAFVARFGGEEFVVLMERPETVAAAFQVSERIRTSIERLSIDSPGGTGVTISIGLAVAHEQMSSSVALLENADRALYAAKVAGRNRVAVAMRDDDPKPFEGSRSVGPDSTADALANENTSFPYLDGIAISAARGF